MLSRLVGDPSNVSTIAIAAVAAFVVIGGVLAATIGAWRLGSAWTLRGTGEGVSLVSSSSGTAGVLYDLAVGSGLLVDYLGGNVKIWLDDPVIDSGVGQSLVSASNGVTTLYDLGDNGFATFDVSSPGLITAARTAPETGPVGVSVTSTSSNALTYFASATFTGKQDTVTATDGSTWTHVTLSGIVTMQFNGTGYINVFTTVPTFAVVNSTYTATQYYYMPLVAAVGLSTAQDAVVYTPFVRIETTPAGWVGGIPTMSWFFITGTALNTPVTLFVSFNGYVRLT